MFPHTEEMDFLTPIDRGNFHGTVWSGLEYTKHFVGVLSYLMRLHWLPDTEDYADLSQPIQPDGPGTPPPPTKLSRDAFPYSGFLELQYEDTPDTLPEDGSLPDIPIFKNAIAACEYLLYSMHKDLIMRFSTARCETFRWHILAKWQLLFNLSQTADVTTAVDEWNYMPTRYVKEPAWSDDQKAVLDDIHGRLDRTDPLWEAPNPNPIYLGGDPGTGKSEILVHAAIRAASKAIRVLIMCPTGPLVHAYRERIPHHPLITIDTIHSAMVIVREADKVHPLTLLIGYHGIPPAKASWDQQASRPTSPRTIRHCL